MSHRLPRRLATILAVVLGVAGLAGQPGHASPNFDPCDPDSGVSIDDFIMWDGFEGGTADLTVWARTPCDRTRMIIYRTFDITAKAGEDYIGVPQGIVILPAGKVSTTLKIQILGSPIPEPPETFGVRLLDGASFDDPEAIVTIVTR